MDIIHVVAWTEDQSYNQWLTESNQLLGLPDDSWACVGLGPPYEFVWIDGVLYRRALEWAGGQVFFYREEGAGTTPDVLCQCGSFEFTLRYGLYELEATCAKCGKSETVYDG